MAMDAPAAASPQEEVDEVASRELARNLPALVAQLKALRADMERKSALYDALLQQQPRSTAPTAPTSAPASQGERQSVFTPFRHSEVERPSLSDDAVDNDGGRYSMTMASRQSSMLRKQQQQQQQQQQRRSGRAAPTMPLPPPVSHVLGDYTVMWVSGECGISLRNFSRKQSKVGAQIAVLQHADGVTTGISNCRLGDQLVSVNEDRVDSLRFREIVEKLKTTRRPISLGFRTNASVQTSPRASASPASYDFSSTAPGSSSSSNSSHKSLPRAGSFRSRLSLRKAKKKEAEEETLPNRNTISGGSQRGSESFLDDESQDTVADYHESGYRESATYFGFDERPSYAAMMSANASGRASTSSDTSVTSASVGLPRSTTTSVSSTLSDEVELWCKEQEEMHSSVIVLLTETVLRCERLQQENLDQMQSLLQLTPSASASSPRANSFNSSSRASSFTESPSKTSSDRKDELELDAAVPEASSAMLASPTA